MTTLEPPGNPASSSSQQLRPAERLLFASGDIFGGGGAAILSVCYLFFLTDINGLAPGLAGLVIGIGKVWDAVSKPLFGQLSDNSRRRWGRRRPFLVFGSVLVVAAMAILYAPFARFSQPLVSALVALASYLFYITTSTMITTPYASMSAEITTHLSERNQVNLLRLVFSTLASATMTVIMTILIKQLKQGLITGLYLYVTLVIIAVVLAVPVLLVGLLCRERVPAPTVRVEFSLRQFVQPLQVAAFRSLTILYLCQALVLDMISNLLLIYTTHVVTIEPAIFMAVIIAVNLCAFIVIAKVLKTGSKAMIYRALLPVGILAGVAITLWPTHWPAWGVYLLAVFFAAGIAGATQICWVMFPDVVDAGELQLGQRNSGTFQGLLTFIRAIGTAIMVTLVGMVLQVSGYQKAVNSHVHSQPDTALWAIRLLLLSAFVIFLSTGWWFARTYPLTIRECQRIRRDLDARRSFDEPVRSTSRT